MTDNKHSGIVDDKKLCRVVVLISGSGSNLQALIDAQQHGLPIVIDAVISNKPDVFGLERAQKAGIPQHIINHKEYADRESFDQALASIIDTYHVDLVVLAGFMRILTGDFVRRYHGRMLNIHPSLLPKYQGLNTHQRALDAQDDYHGVTVHFVTEELDGGPNIIQAIVPILADDTATSLSQRVQQQEHIIYPMAVEWFAKGQLSLCDNRVILNNTTLASEGYQINSQPSKITSL